MMSGVLKIEGYEVNGFFLQRAIRVRCKRFLNDGGFIRSDTMK